MGVAAARLISWLACCSASAALCPHAENLGKPSVQQGRLQTTAPAAHSADPDNDQSRLQKLSQNQPFLQFIR